MLLFLHPKLRVGLLAYTEFAERYAAQNFCGAMARSAKVTIVEAEEIVPVGSIDPNHVHLPGILFVPFLPSSFLPRLPV